MQIYENICNEADLFLKTTDILFPDVQKEKILIYDIESTSYEAANGCLFLIGTMCYEGGHLISRQYFSESISEESEIIVNFLNLSENFSLFLSYKGESFDIPFIGKRLYAINMGNMYLKLQSIRSHSFDLFTEIHQLKSGLDFSSTKLEAIREKFGQKVPDRVKGEDIYRFYVEHIAASKLRNLLEVSECPKNKGFINSYVNKNASDELPHISPDSGDRFLNDILLKNRESMTAVLYLLRISHLFVIRNGQFSANLIPGSIDTSDQPKDYTLNISERDFTLDMHLESQQMELLQFYPNFKDYYYFPAEDMAIHRSVAEFASSTSKKKATSKTAYRRVKGYFVHIPRGFALAESNKNSPKYKSHYESEAYYLPIDDVARLDPERLKELAYFYTLEYGRKDLSSLLIPLPY